MKKLLFLAIFLFPSAAGAARLGGLNSGADVLTMGSTAYFSSGAVTPLSVDYQILPFAYNIPFIRLGQNIFGSTSWFGSLGGRADTTTGSPTKHTGLHIMSGDGSLILGQFRNEAQGNYQQGAFYVGLASGTALINVPGNALIGANVQGTVTVEPNGLVVQNTITTNKGVSMATGTITTLLAKPILGTDSSGNIIASTGGAGAYVENSLLPTTTTQVYTVNYGSVTTQLNVGSGLTPGPVLFFEGDLSHSPYIKWREDTVNSQGLQFWVRNRSGTETFVARMQDNAKFVVAGFETPGNLKINDFYIQRGGSQAMYLKDSGESAFEFSGGGASFTEYVKMINGRAAAQVLVLKSAASQSANIQEWRDSSENPLTFVSSDGGHGLASKTLAQLAALTPTVAGIQYYCSNCVTDAICISTGTAIASFSRVTSKTTVCQ